MVTRYSDANTLSTCAVVTIAPIVGQQGKSTARHNGRLLCRSKHPICDAARALRDSGYPLNTFLIVKDAASGISVPTTTIARAARLTANDMRFGTPGFRPWKAPQGEVGVHPGDVVALPVAAGGGQRWDFLEAAE
jgi:hypothetical protein